jgi:hypothetical protein
MRLPILVAVLAWILPLCLASGLAAQSANAPLPDPEKLLQCALANEKKLADEQERYECRVTSDGAELDKTGKLKHETIEVEDQFYVNGQQIERTLSRNGKDCRPKKHAKRMSA